MKPSETGLIYSDPLQGYWAERDSDNVCHCGAQLTPGSKVNICYDCHQKGPTVIGTRNQAFVMSPWRAKEREALMLYGETRSSANLFLADVRKEMSK